MKKYVLLAWVAATSASFAQTPGDVNLNFGNNGHQVYDLTPSEADNAGAVAIQADGKIILGTTQNVAGNHNFVITRLNQDGSIDNSFDFDGKKTIDINNWDELSDIKVLSNGKIVAVGYTDDPVDNEDGVAIMLNSDGSLDNSFGNQGIVQLDQTAGEVDMWTNVEEISGGNIVIGGMLVAAGKVYFSVRSLTPTGANNPNFNSAVDFIELPNITTSLSTSMAVSSTGEILVAGYGLEGAQYKNVICAWNANGSKNYNFFTTAYRIFHLESGDLNAIFDIDYDKNGDIVALGLLGTSNMYDMMMMRLSPAGYNDTSFASVGYTRSDLSLGASDEMLNLHILPNNHYLAVGRLNAGDSDVMLAVVDEKGDLDESWGNNGKVVTDFGYTDHDVWGSAVRNGVLYLTAETQGNTSQDILVGSYYAYSTIGVEEEIIHNSLEVYPNPAVDRITIDIADIAINKVEILDMTGKVLHSEDVETASSQLDLQVGQWPSGVYMLRLKGDNELHTSRFIIQ